MSRAVLDAVLNAHAGRFEGDGVHHVDLEKIISGVSDWDEWFDAWSAQGEEYARVAEECAAEGAMASAGEFWWQASLRYQYAQFLWFHDRPRREGGQRRKVDLYDRAAPYLLPARRESVVRYTKD